MPVLSTDVVWYQSTKAAAMGFTLGASGPGYNLGGYISITPIVDNTLNNIFVDIQGDENITYASDYQCIFIANNNPYIPLTSAIVWITNKPGGGASVAIAKDIVGPVSLNSSQPQATSIPLPSVAPTLVGLFSTPTTKAAGVLLGDIGPQQCAALWIKRTANNNGSQKLDGVTLRIEGGTTP